MKKSLFVFVFAFCLAAAARAQTPIQSSPAYAYSLKVDESRNQRLSIQIVAARPASSRASFCIPAWTPGYYQILHYEKNVEHVHAEDESGRSLTVVHPSIREWDVIFRFADSRRVIFSYDIKANEPGFGFFASSIDTKRKIGYVNGASAFMYPLGDSHPSITLAVSLPPGWKTVSPLESTDGVFHAADYDELIDCPLQFGKFELFDFHLNAIHFSCALIGEPQHGPAKLTDKLSRIARTAVEVFGSAPFRQYVFIYHIGESGFIGGLEHRSSTVIHLDDPIGDGEDDDFLTTTAHELFHAWNVKQIRPEGLGPFDYTQPVRTRSLWFSEGVTDYYADLLPVRAGLRTPEWFVQHLAERIHELDTNPARLRVSAEEASQKAWEGSSEGFGGLSYYLKGSLIGCWFDLKIREASNGTRSLDDVMREMDRRYGQRQRPFPESALLTVMNAIAGADLTEEYIRYVRGVQEMEWEELLPGIGWMLNRQRDGYLGASFVPNAPFDDFDDSDDSERPAIVQKVEGGFPAEKMGLRAGDRILTINGREVTYGLAGVIVRSLPAASHVNMTVLRNGKIVGLQGECGTQYSHHRLTILPPETQNLDIRRIQSGLFTSKPIQQPAITTSQ